MSGECGRLKSTSENLQKSIELLAENPQRGRARDEVRGGYNSYSFGSHVVFYKIFSGHIEVVRILHQRMDFDSHLQSATSGKC